PLRERAIRVRARHLRPARRRDRDVSPRDRDLLLGLLVRDRTPRYHGYGPLLRPGDRRRRAPHDLRPSEVPAHDGHRRPREGRRADAPRDPSGRRGYGRRLRQPLQRAARRRALRQRRRRFPDAKLAFNWSSSFKWFNDPNPISFAELGELGYKFLFITLAAQHAMGYAFSKLLQGVSEEQERAYVALQRKEWATDEDIPTKSHHLFTGVPYHQVLGQ